MGGAELVVPQLLLINLFFVLFCMVRRHSKTVEVFIVIVLYFSIYAVIIIGRLLLFRPTKRRLDKLTKTDSKLK